jgi:hypothetical protein
MRLSSWHRRTRQRTSKFDRVISAIQVVDASHPLFGRTLTLLSEHCSRGKAFVAAALEDGRRRLILRSATDLDARSHRAPQRAWISARSLLALARHVQCYLSRVEGEEALDARSAIATTPRKRSQSSDQPSSTPATAGRAITGSPQSARPADRKDPAASSRRGSRRC